MTRLTFVRTVVVCLACGRGIAYAQTCGDGVVGSGEQCDDGNIVADDGCSPVCAVAPGFVCTGQPSFCTTIELVGRCETSGYANGVAISGRHAYVSVMAAGLDVFDIWNPRSCRKVASCATSGLGYHVAVSGDYAYVAAYDGGLDVIDISNPESCSVVANCPAVSGRYVHLVVSGGRAYIAADMGGLHIFDVSNPEGSCQYLGACATSDDAFGVEALNDYAYVAVDEAGLQVFDVSDPASCVSEDLCDIGERASGVAVANGYAYVASGLGGLYTFDITPANSCGGSSVAHCDTIGWADDIEVSGPYAYIADHQAGELQVFDISTPGSCRWAGEYRSGVRSADELTVSATYVYLAERNDGVAIVRIGHTCGDRLIDAGEQCDDGNTAGGDGCSALCTIEEHWECSGEPSVCRSTIPTVSEWGLVAMTLLVLMAGTVVLAKRPAAPRRPTSKFI